MKFSYHIYSYSPIAQCRNLYCEKLFPTDQYHWWHPLLHFKYMISILRFQNSLIISYSKHATKHLLSILRQCTKAHICSSQVYLVMFLCITFKGFFHALHSVLQKVPCTAVITWVLLTCWGTQSSSFSTCAARHKNYVLDFCLSREPLLDYIYLLKKQSDH